MDAIRRAKRNDGKIEIEIDQQKKSILVKDNGAGILSDKIGVLLSPFSTDKEDEYEAIGEKGVGLKFVMFQGNYFKLVTRAQDEEHTSVAVVEDAHHWLRGRNVDDESVPKLQLSQSDEMDDCGCSVYVECDSYDDDEEEDSYLKLFKMPLRSLEYVVRTKTACGNVYALMEDVDHPIAVKLAVVNYKGEREIEDVPFRFFVPTDATSKKNIYDLNDFVDWLSSGDYTDAQKRGKLRGKIIVKKGTIERGGRSVRYWSCFLPQRRIWNDLSIQAGLLKESEADNVEAVQSMANEIFQPGIFTSVKGMPTGISIEHPSSGFAGYWSNLFIIFEDDMLKFDIGRKSIGGRTKGLYRQYAKAIFEEYLKYVTKYMVGGDVEVADPKWDRDEIIEEIKKLPALNLDGNGLIKFEKLPSDQEASVAAIFYELVGAGKMNFVPVISGYRNRYDLYAKLDNHYEVIEFKSHLRNIVRDFEDAKKMSDEIDFVVCWDVNDEDIKALRSRDIEVIDLDDTSDFDNMKKAVVEKSGATHKLVASVVANPVYVIDLKKYIKKLGDE